MNAPDAPEAPALPNVYTWPHRKVPGWNGPQDDEAVPAPFPALGLLEALRTAHDSDAHAVGYVVRSTSTAEAEAYAPRLGVAAVAPLASAGYTVHVETLWIDVDNPGHAPWKDAAEARATLDLVFEAGGALLDGFAGYTTRHGLRLVAALRFPVHVGAFKAVVGTSPDPQGTGGGKAGSGFLGRLYDVTGLVADRCSNEWSRCMRLPHTTATADLDVAERFEALQAGRTFDPTPYLPTTTTAATIGGDPSIFDGLDAPEGEALLAWIPSADEFEASGLQKPLRARWPGLYKALKAGKTWFRRSGERNTQVFEAVALVAEVLQCAEPRELYGFFYTSLVAATGAQGPSATGTDEALVELWDVCTRRAAHEAARAEAEAEAKREGEAKRAALIAASHAEGPDGGMLPPILVHDSVYYVLDARDIDGDGDPGSGLGLRYFPPTKNTSALRMLLELGCADLDLYLFTSKGAFRALPGLLAQYGYQIDRVIKSLSARTPSIQGRTLRLPAALRAPVEPVEHPDVEAWLRCLGGDDCEALLDWLATYPILDRATCAVYLQGPPGTGKGLFAAGVATLYGAAPVTFAEAVGRFNDALARCPVVFLDEKVVPATTASAEALSAAFRSLVAETTRRVEAKGKPTATLEGAVRVIIAANNDDALPLQGDHTADDIRAVSQRIRHFTVDPNARDHLGWARTHDWVRRPDKRPGKIAEHVMHLFATRVVTPGERFLVPGVKREYHERLALTSHRLDTLAAVARSIALGTEGARRHGIELRGDPVDGPVRCFVNASDLRKRWHALTGDTRTPSQASVTGALQALEGVKRVRYRNFRYFDVPLVHVLRAASVYQVSTEHVLRTHLGMPTKGPAVLADPVEPDRLSPLRRPSTA